MSAVVTIALLVALPGAAAALASSPTSAQYDTTNHQIAGGGGASEPSGGNDPVISGLPFTGVDLVLLGIVALALVGAGISLQRLSRTPESDELT